MKLTKIYWMLIFLFISNCANAHGGRTNSQGCHNQKSTGGYHCHNGGSSTPKLNAALKAQGVSKYYRNCSSARAAGAAPIKRGEPGYARHLDRDGDGLACE